MSFNIQDYYKEEIKVKANKVTYTKFNYGHYTFSLDSITIEHLETLCNDLKDDDDALVILVGDEGAGKSYLASQICYFASQNLNSKYTIKNVHFDGQPYIDFAIKNPKFTINHLDESRRALNKMRSVSKSNVKFMDFMSECRADNQFHVLLLPAYTDLDQYVAVHRVKLIISVEKARDEKRKLKRGIFNIIDTTDKSKLKYCWDNKYKKFSRSMIVHTSKFDKVMCLDKQAYDKKKKKAKEDRYKSKAESKEEEVVNKFEKGLEYIKKFNK